jgi:hypothetical protein
MIRRLGHFKRDIVTALVGAGFEAEASGGTPKGQFSGRFGAFSAVFGQKPTVFRDFSSPYLRLICQVTD